MSDALAKTLTQYAERHAARVLTQLDRDPDSPTYGCFDRNYWHYKIRDFASSILQQGLFLLEALRQGQLSNPQVDSKIAGEWTLAAVNALSWQVDSAGRVDEYYPYEESYPAAAFGLYAVSKVLWQWQQEKSPLLARVDWRGLKRLARALSKRTEPQAANQFAAGLAGLAMAQHVPELEVKQKQVAKLADVFFELQHEEGWFPEYGGPDFGYLTVTIDALADYADATGDERAPAAAKKAISFLASLVGADGDLPWTLNSRNTDYITPYGLSRFAADDAEASLLLHQLFKNALKPEHFLANVDDRYHCHYVYASLVRSLPFAEAAVAPVGRAVGVQRLFAGCGYWVQHSAKNSVYIGAKKGGLVRVHYTNKPAVVDHGWRVKNRHGQLFSNNWWQDDWVVTVREHTVQVRGPLVRVGFQNSSPFKHVVLRMLALVLRKKLMPLLKNIMIFRPQAAKGPAFERTIVVDEKTVELTDGIAVCHDATAYVAPRQNRRHVASADSFHAEEGRAPLLQAAPTVLEKPLQHQQIVKL